MWEWFALLVAVDSTVDSSALCRDGDKDTVDADDDDDAATAADDDDDDDAGGLGGDGVLPSCETDARPSRGCCPPLPRLPSPPPLCAGAEAAAAFFARSWRHLRSRPSISALYLHHLRVSRWRKTTLGVVGNAVAVPPALAVGCDDDADDDDDRSVASCLSSRSCFKLMRADGCVGRCRCGIRPHHWRGDDMWHSSEFAYCRITSANASLCCAARSGAELSM
jgi:hypothetical protein